MTEQSSETAAGMDEVAEGNRPGGASGERPASGAGRRVEPGESPPAANQRAGEPADPEPAKTPAAPGGTDAEEAEGDTPATTDLPLSGVFRPSAPSGEVSPT